VTGNAGDNANNGNNNNNNILNYKQYETDNSANECVSVVWKSIGRHHIHGTRELYNIMLLHCRNRLKSSSVRSIYIIIYYCNAKSKVLKKYTASGVIKMFDYCIDVSIKQYI
jgi:hypothetical protein